MCCHPQTQKQLPPPQRNPSCERLPAQRFRLEALRIRTYRRSSAQREQVADLDRLLRDAGRHAERRLNVLRPEGQPLREVAADGDKERAAAQGACSIADSRGARWPPDDGR
jgi:hypothetical protein